MKNKFLIPSLLFVVGLIFLIFPATSSASITSITTDTATSTSKTGAQLKGTIDIAADEAYDSRGFTLGTASSTRGNYNLGSSTVSGTFAGPGSFYHTTTTLPTKGEVYYSRAYAASSTDGASGKLLYGDQQKFITGIDDPASLAQTGSSRSFIALSWTKGTGAGNTYLRYRTDLYPTSITDGSEGCITSGSSCSIDSLACGTTHYIRAWSSTSEDGLSTTSDSYAQLTPETDSCLAAVSGGQSCAGPRAFADSLVINQGAAETQTRQVTLSLKADSATLMSICNNSRFIGCSLESYSTTKSWTLTEGDGEKTVYAVFTSDCGKNSENVSDTITFKTPKVVAEVPKVVEEVPAPAPAPTPEPTPTPEVTPTPTPVPAPVEKPIAEMTIDELKAKIAEILAQVQALQAELPKLKVVVVFEINLKYGNRGDDVVKLQDALIEEGVLSGGLNTGWFGPATKAAVIKFQEKYASEVLTPNGLSKGTGFVGSSTRTKLNSLLGR